MQCLLLADGKRSAHQSHVVILPGNGGSGMAAISFVGALKIPVSTRAWEELRKGSFAHAGERGCPVDRQAREEQSGIPCCERGSGAQGRSRGREQAASAPSEQG